MVTTQTRPLPTKWTTRETARFYYHSPQFILVGYYDTRPLSLETEMCHQVSQQEAYRVSHLVRGASRNAFKPQTFKDGEHKYHLFFPPKPPRLNQTFNQLQSRHFPNQPIDPAPLALIWFKSKHEYVLRKFWQNIVCEDSAQSENETHANSFF